jgi:hypothetical protein
MKALFLSLAALAGLACASAPALAHGHYRDHRYGKKVVRYRHGHHYKGYRKVYRYPARYNYYRDPCYRDPCYRDPCYYPSGRYCPPPCER